MLSVGVNMASEWRLPHIEKGVRMDICDAFGVLHGIILVEGGLGCGKSLFLAWWQGYRQELGASVTTNMRLHVPHNAVHSISDVRRASNGLLVLDEAYLTSDSRRAMDEQNIVVNHIIQMSRKKRLDVVICAQHIGMVDLRIRQLANFLVEPQTLLKTTSGYVPTRHGVTGKPAAMMLNVWKSKRGRFYPFATGQHRLQPFGRIPSKVFESYDTNEATYELIPFKAEKKGLAKHHILVQEVRDKLNVLAPEWDWTLTDDQQMFRIHKDIIGVNGTKTVYVDALGSFMQDKSLRVRLDGKAIPETRIPYLVAWKDVYQQLTVRVVPEKSDLHQPHKALTHNRMLENTKEYNF